MMLAPCLQQFGLSFQRDLHHLANLGVGQRPAYDAWGFDADEGNPYVFATYGATAALAVCPGDVPVVPKPGTCTLMLAGLATLPALARRRFH
jgi:hypothetical protein